MFVMAAHGEPSGGVSKGIPSVPYGRPVALPEPFGFEVDTAESV